MVDPQSDILSALYRGQRDEALRLASAAGSLTIWEAAALGRDADVERLIAEDPGSPNTCAPDGHFPLGLAAFFGHPSTVNVLLSHGASVHAAAQNDMKVQPLHAAVAGRNAEAVAALLDRGADPNARQQAGYTPLMAAAGANRDDLVNLLLARGADPSVVSDEGKSASAIAAEHGHAAIAGRLAMLETRSKAER
jgi:ankyrin repeat protein